LLFLFLSLRRTLISTFFPYTTLFRSSDVLAEKFLGEPYYLSNKITCHRFTLITLFVKRPTNVEDGRQGSGMCRTRVVLSGMVQVDRKSTRLNSSHLGISYAVFCLKKK